MNETNSIILFWQTFYFWGVILDLYKYMEIGVDACMYNLAFVTHFLPCSCRHVEEETRVLKENDI